MGACATKPKVLKPDSGEAPAPAPEPAPEDIVAAPTDSKLENGSDDKATEIADVDDDKVDSKSRSLSHLFSDKKTEADPCEKQLETPPETEKQIINPAPAEAEDDKKLPETNPAEPPPSDSNNITEKTTIISDEKTIETPSEDQKIKENPQPIEDNIKVEDEVTIHTESSENPAAETEKQVKVISN